MFKAINIGANGLKFLIAIIGCGLAVWAAYKWDADARNVSEIIPYVSGAVYISAIVCVVAAAIAVVFGITKFVMGIRKNIPMLIGVLAFFGILLFAWFGLSSWGLQDYFVARGGKFVDPDVEQTLTQSLLQISDGGVWAVFILVPLAVIAAIVGEVISLFK